MEHIFQNIKGWFSFKNLYKSMVEKFPSGSRFVEIGTYHGCSFSYLVIEVINSGKDIECWGVDACPWPDVEPTFNENMKPLVGHYKTKFGGDSFDRIKEFEDNSIDFAFVDANHEYEFVKRDIEALLPKMKSGGVLAGHDYNSSHPGVLKAVQEAFVEEVNRDYYITGVTPKKPGYGFTYDKIEDVWCVQL
jgi:cephalosporin hydroxylase